MQSRQMNRRSLCKTIVTMGLIAASDRLTALRIGEWPGENQNPAQFTATEKEGLICVLCARPARKRKHRAAAK